jgi:hypothetical protein
VSNTLTNDWKRNVGTPPTYIYASGTPEQEEAFSAIVVPVLTNTGNFNTNMAALS